MSFANPGSRQAIGGGSYRRWPTLLPGQTTNVLDLPLWGAQSLSSGNPSMGTNNVGGNGSNNGNLWNYIGVKTTSADWASGWKTVGSLSNASGNILNIIGPEAATFQKCRITVDGTVTIIDFGSYTSRVGIGAVSEIGYSSDDGVATQVDRMTKAGAAADGIATSRIAPNVSRQLLEQAVFASSGLIRLVFRNSFKLEWWTGTGITNNFYCNTYAGVYYTRTPLIGTP